MTEVLKLVSAALGGGIIAAFLTHHLTRRRERERDSDNRKREFRAFLRGWCSELERIPEHHVPEILKHYRVTVDGLHEAKGLVRGDFLPVEEFDRLSARLGGFRHDDLTNDAKETRDIIAEAIDEFVQFTNAA
jgi:hypothetical protein